MSHEEYEKNRNQRNTSNLEENRDDALPAPLALHRLLFTSRISATRRVATDVLSEQASWPASSCPTRL